MTWVRLDDGFADHPKLEQISDYAFRLHVSAMCWSSRRGTDGRISKRDLYTLASRLVSFDGNPLDLATELVSAKNQKQDGPGLWEPIEGGWLIHDWLDFNPTAQEVAIDRAAAAERMRKLRANRKERSGERSESRSEEVPQPRPVPSRPNSYPTDQTDPPSGGSPARAHAERGQTEKAEPHEPSKIESNGSHASDGWPAPASTGGTPARSQGAARAETTPPVSWDGSRGGCAATQNAAASGQVGQTQQRQLSSAPRAATSCDGSDGTGRASASSPDGADRDSARTSSHGTAAPAQHSRPLETLPGMRAETERGGVAGDTRETGQGGGQAQVDQPQPVGASGVRLAPSGGRAPIGHGPGFSEAGLEPEARGDRSVGHESSDEPVPVSTEDALLALGRFRARSTDLDGVPRFAFLADRKGKPQAVEIERFRKAWERTQATQSELDEMARLIGSGEEYGTFQTVACSMLCDDPGRRRDRRDNFAELKIRAQTPKRKRAGPPAWKPDPTVGRRADDPDKVSEELERWKQG